ncbi:MAG: hypothetical protein AAF386_05690, partial [Pseudomonadota bacterium]
MLAQLRLSHSQFFSKKCAIAFRASLGIDHPHTKVTMSSLSNLPGDTGETPPLSARIKDVESQPQVGM